MLETVLSFHGEPSAFDRRRRLLVPALAFCTLFFACYYAFLILPTFGFSSEVFMIDSLGGSSVLLGFLVSIGLSRRVRHDGVLLIPSLSTVIASVVFLFHQSFYEQMPHLWIYALVIGIIFSIFFGTPRLNFVLFLINATVPLAVAFSLGHLDFQLVAIQQSIIFFAGLSSIFLAWALQVDHRNLERALGEKEVQEEHLNRTNRMGRIGGWSLDVETQKMWWSNETFNIHDLPVGTEVDVAEAINFYAEEARPIISAAVQQGLEKGTGWNLELPFVTAKGREIWVHAIGECHTKPDGSKVIQGTFQDITEKKKNDESLKVALKRAERAAASKALFLANMSHEIRTPMNGVLGNADLLLDEGLNPGQKKIVSTIIQSGEAMMQILNDILDFSKIDAGQLDIDLHPFDLAEQLESIFQLFETRVAEKGIKFSLEMDPQLPRVVVSDSTRFRQIMSNLVSNAIKFTEEGAVKVLAKVSKSEGQTHNIIFEVRDTGVGIDASSIDRLFLEFEQADATTTKEFGGTGLGLAISQRLAGLLSSEIKVESEPGVGSCFYFELKIQESRVDEAPATQNQVEELGSMEGLRVLLVEDNQINRELAVNFLGRLGITCATAVNGQDAVSQVQNAEFDIVFMDCQMPVMDGFEATQRIRKLALSPQPIVIALTANALVSDEQRCRDAGMDDYLTKPVSRKKLHAILGIWHKRVEKKPAS